MWLRANKGLRDSVHKEFSREYVQDKSTLAPYSPKIAFRLITRATDSRTMRAVDLQMFFMLIPQIVMMPHGDKQDEAFLLGCSHPFH